MHKTYVLCDMLFVRELSSSTNNIL